MHFSIQTVHPTRVSGGGAEERGAPGMHFSIRTVHPRMHFFIQTVHPWSTERKTMNTRKFIIDVIDQVRVALDQKRPSIDANRYAGAGRPAAFPYMNPHQRQGGDSASGVEGLFQSTISDAERMEMAQRCGPAKAICFGFCEDALDQGFDILDGSGRDVTGKFEPAYTELIRGPLLSGLQSARVYGFAGVLAVYTGGSGFETRLPSRNGRVSSFVAIPKPWVEQIEVALDERGRVVIPRRMLGYKMVRECSIARIDASRVEHIAEPSGDPDASFTGASALDVAFDGLTVWKHILWGLGQCFWRSGNGLLSVTGPEGAEEWQLNMIDDALSNISATTAFALPYGCEVKKHATDALGPREYEEAALDEVASASRIPRKVLLGVQKGAISGSEADIELYMSTLSSYQTSVVEGVLRGCFERLQATGQIMHDGGFGIEWRSPETLGEKEKADVALTIARTEFIRERVLKGVLGAEGGGGAGVGSGGGD